MGKAKKRVSICMICVVMVAIVVGILYYYNELGDEAVQSEGTLISLDHKAWDTLWQ